MHLCLTVEVLMLDSRKSGPEECFALFMPRLPRSGSGRDNPWTEITPL